MTVGELIEALSGLPPEMTVMVDDREDGRQGADVAEVSTYYGTLPRHVVIR